MQNIASTIELKNAIHLLEEDQLVKGHLLKEQFFITYESLKPVNVLSSTLHDISSSPYLMENILGSAMGIASGFLTRKIFVGSSGSLIRKLLGSVIQFGVTNVVAQHPESVKSLGQVILKFLLTRKRTNSIKQ
jgi:hypothetical protein